MFIADGKNCFDSVLFYGNETTLVVFELLLFSLVDIYCHNYLTAGLTVFIIFKVRESRFKTRLNCINDKMFFPFLTTGTSVYAVSTWTKKFSEENYD